MNGSINGTNEEPRLDKASRSDGTGTTMPIAIVGMACRLPGRVSDLESFWQFCLAAKNSWTEIPKDRMSTSTFYHPDPEKIGAFHIKGAHFLQESIAAFDAPFFNITANEAKSMDPRHRLLLECTYEALENGGIPLTSIAGHDVGVFVGGTLSHYELECLRDLPKIPRLHFMGCADSLLANRISYFFDLHGPSVTIDTACSSGLTALHMACQSLRTGEIRQAIVGGAHLNLMPEMLAAASTGMFLSADGKCYPFDERVSGGFGPGEGASCVILKPLRDAIEAGDNVRAIIRGTGINQDGRTAGIALPSSDAQAKLIRSVYSSVGLEPSETKVIEAHGTGTTVGDPLEASAFAATIAKAATAQDPVYIGSSKSNFGHLEGVSGIVSLIKGAMMLANQTILPSANFKVSNPKITSLGTQLQVPPKALLWRSEGVRRVSVNNLGFGGANAHAIIEEAPETTEKSDSHELLDGPQLQNGNGSITPLLSSNASIHRLFVITAHGEASLKRQRENLMSYLLIRRDDTAENLPLDLAFTLGQRRSLLPWRIGLAASTTEDLIAQLKSSDKVPMRASKAPKLGFVFSGQGANWQGMGQELFKDYPIFSSAILTADQYLTSLGASWSLIRELFVDTGGSLFSTAQVSQPASTAIQLALVLLLRSFGVHPHSVTGHSSGEIGAAFAAGALTFEACLSIAYYRGVSAERLKRIRPDMKGAMLALGASPEAATAMIQDAKGGQVVIACINSPSSVTLAGDVEAIVTLQAVAEEKSIFARRLHVDVAYHSPHMDVIAEDYRAAMGVIKPTRSKNVDFYSSLTGAKISTLALGSSYWVNNLKSPVKFAKSLFNCCSLNRERPTSEDSVTHLIEIGPHSALKGPIRDILTTAPKTSYKIGYSSTLVRKESAAVSILNLVSDLFMKGCDLTMTAINFPRGEGGRKVLCDLPPYSWNHDTEYWHESRVSRSHRVKDRSRNDILGTLVPISSDLEPWWRNVLRLDDVPWLRHHKIRSNAVFPFAGYVSMAVEAANQRAAFRNLTPTAIELQEIHTSQPLILLEGIDTEMMLTLRPLTENAKNSSESWDEFRIFSWTEDSNWVEHCRGQISVNVKSKISSVNDVCQSPTAVSATQEYIRQIECASVRDVTSPRIYEDASKIGFEYGPCLTMLSDCRIGGENVTATVRVPDTAATMPLQSESPLIVHPALLDNCVHVVWPLLGAGVNGVDGLYLPASVKKMFIQLDPGAQYRDRVRVYGKAAAETDPSERVIESIIVTNGDQMGSEPAITINGMVLVSLSDEQAVKERIEKTAFSKMHWEPSVDLLEPNQFEDHFGLEKAPNEEMTLVKDLERASMYYIQRALEIVTDSHVPLLQLHHQKLYHLMVKQLEAAKAGNNQLLDNNWDIWTYTEQESFLASLRAGSTSGEFTCKMGENLPQILLNITDPLSIMLADGLLERLYRDSGPMRRNSAQAAQLISNVAHGNPNLRILEIGAGTGATTLPILEKLGGTSGHVPRFQDYVFTDIDSGFFENAQEKLKAWSPLITFQRLNIEDDPVGQNFEAESFDLVVAALVLHATARISQTLHHVRRLLKPGGKLVVIEITTVRAHHFPFATLPGWWLGEPEVEQKAVKDFLHLSELDDTITRKGSFREDGPLLTETQWDRILKGSGFTGVDRSLHDYPGEAVHSNSLLVSTASNKVEPSPGISKDWIIVQSRESSRYSLSALNEQVKAIAGNIPLLVGLSQISNMDLKDRYCIFLDELECPILAKMSSETYQAIQNLCTAARVLWVIQGAQGDLSANPESAMAIGLTRSVRSENPAVRLVTLDLDSQTKLSPSRTSEVIATVCRAAFTQEGNALLQPLAQESEFLERGGILHIPRVVQDFGMEQRIQNLTRNLVPTEQTSFEPNRAVSLKIGSVGLLDTFYFDQDDHFKGSLGTDEVEIQIRAAGLNFRDLMTALGRLPPRGIGFDYAGVITAVGSKVLDFTVGDRVCGLSPGAFGTTMRCVAACAAKISESIDFETAASLPVVYTTVYHSLINLARLGKGETILIHAAAGGVGQAAIMLSQSIGAEIFATVGNSQKEELLITRYGIPKDHIFFSRDTSFEERIMSTTGGRGVDVVLSSTSGDIRRATWRCLAHFGRFVDLGKADILANNRLDMEPFNDNRIYAAIDVRTIALERPVLMKEILAKCVELYTQGIFKPVEPITVFSFSQSEAAFRKMQGGDNMGKIVLIPELRGPIKIMPHKTVMSTLSAEASYLLTGGSGGLAVAFARWLAEHGAKYIILASRSGIADADTTKMIETLKARGVVILPFKCDVTDPNQVNELVGPKLSHIPPIKGVIQGAFIDKSALFEKSTISDYNAVIRPKVQGTWNLHHTLQHHPLDFFISMASVTGVFGNQGQSAYSATTTFLEAFSAYRASLGLAATTIDLGAVIEVGALTKQSEATRNRGVEVTGGRVRWRDLLAVLDAAISGAVVGRDSHYCTIMGLQCTGSSAQSFWAQTPMFSHMRARKGSGEQKEDGGKVGERESTRRQLVEVESMGEAKAVIYDALALKISGILMIEDEDLSPNRPLGSYGSDSLVAVEIRNWIRREMDATVILVEILADNTLSTLTESVVGKSKLLERFR